MSWASCGYVPSDRFCRSRSKFGVPNGITCRWTSFAPPVIPAQVPVPPLFGQIARFSRSRSEPGRTLPPFSIISLVVHRRGRAASCRRMRAPLATPSISRFSYFGRMLTVVFVTLNPTEVPSPAMTPATMLPWVPLPDRVPSQLVPLSWTFWMACTFRWAALGMEWVMSPTWVAVCENCTESAEIPLSVTATICGGTAAVSLLYLCSVHTPPGAGPVQVPVPAPVQHAVGFPAATHWVLLVQSLFVAQVRVGDCVHSRAPLPPPSTPTSWYGFWNGRFSLMFPTIAVVGVSTFIKANSERSYT